MDLYVSLPLCKNPSQNRNFKRILKIKKKRERKFKMEMFSIALEPEALRHLPLCPQRGARHLCHLTLSSSQAVCPLTGAWRSTPKP